MKLLSATALLFLALAAGAVSGAQAAGEPPALVHNPFSRPPSEAKNDDVRIVDSGDGSGPTLTLRATMVGPANRLANVAGRILQAGDEISGYTLIEIHEDYAVFKRNEKLMTVFVRPQRVDDDE